MKTSYRSSGVQPLNARFSSVLRFYALIFAALAPVAALQAQSYYETPYTFTTLAGSPSGGSVDGTASSARFYLPLGVALDASGNCYVAETTNHTIRKITAAGVVTTLAGLAGNRGSADGTGTAARFDSPSGVAVDSTGNVYVADRFNYTIRKITPAGMVTTFAGLAGTSGSIDGTGSAARFNMQNSVAVDGSGNVYVADTGNSTIRKITSSGDVTTFAGLVGARSTTDGTGWAARFESPMGVAVDGVGNVYVADISSHVIRKITPAGVVSTLAGTAGINGSNDDTGSNARFSSPAGVTADAAGNVYVADSANDTIRKITVAGAVTTLAGAALSKGSVDGTGTGARFNGPYGVAVDGTGNVYVADTYNNVVRKITAGGVVTTLAGTALPTGSNDGTGSLAKFYYPAGVAVDGSGNIYVADTSASTIRKITSGGVVTTLAGTAYNYGSADGVGSAASFNLPQSVAVDSAGNVYVADFANCTIRKITSSGVVTTLAGSAGVFGSTNGSVAYARFGYVNGVAVDGSGNVYVADTYNSMIRKITPAGVVTTLAGPSGPSGLSFPFGVAADVSGNVFIADTNSHTIRKIDPAGSVTTLAGSAGLIGSSDGTGSAARFNRPGGITVDGGGNVYVTDGNQTIRRITSAGVVTTLAGAVGQVGTSDGTGSTARFYGPAGLAADGAGNICVADYYNLTIRIGVPSSRHASSSDFDGDGKSDILLSNTVTGDRAMWLMNGTAIGTNAFAGTVPTNWIVSGTGDFDGDGKADIFWTNTTTGDRAAWLMNGNIPSMGGYLGAIPVEWVVSGSGDFNGDGKSDIVWTNTTTGERTMWLMNGLTASGGASLGVVPVAWAISGTGDFNGDGKTDILLSNTSTGDRVIWFMNGTTIGTNAFAGTVPPAWAVSGVGDFDGDGKADIFWTNAATGDRAAWLMNGNIPSMGGYLGAIPVEWVVSATGDYNGDGKADILWTNTTTGERSMWLMNGLTTSGGASLGVVPVAWVTGN